MVLRFNFNEAKRVCGLDEIFEIPPEAKVSIPDAWMNNIKTSYEGGYGGYHGNGSTPGVLTQFPHAHGRGRGVRSALIDNGPGSRQGSGPAVIQEEKYAGLEFGFGGSLADYYEEMERKAAGEPGAKKPQASAENAETSRSCVNNQSVGIAIDPDSGCVREVSNVAATDLSHVHLNLKDKDPAYLDYLTASFGEEVANGYDQAMAGLDDIEPGLDEVLTDIIKEAYSKMTRVGQMRLLLRPS